MRKTIFFLVCAVFAVAACQPAPLAQPTADSQQGGGQVPTEPALEGQSTPSLTAPAPQDDILLTDVPYEEHLVSLAKEDLAQRIAAPQELINVVQLQYTEWSDSSMGCPQEGMMYAQVITPGYFILLEAGGLHYPYHADLRGNIFLCEQDNGGGVLLTPFPADPSEIQDGVPWVPVD